MIAHRRFVLSSLLLLPISFVALACYSRTGMNTSTAVSAEHAKAISHMAAGMSLKNRGLGQAPSVPRATQDDLKKAVEEFRAALSIEPNDHLTSFDLAECLIKLNKTDEGVVILQTLAKNQDDYARYAQKKLKKMGVPTTQ